MKLGKLLISLVVVSLLVSMAIPMAAAPKGGGGKPPPDEEPPADPAIAFYQTGGRDNDKIMVMNADGSNQAVIFQQEYLSLTGSPSWSPNGNSIAFTGYTYIPNVPGWDFGVWRIDVEIVSGEPQGSNLQQLMNEVEEGFISSIAWSPLGNEIAYTHRIYATDTHDDIWKIDAVLTTGGNPYNIYTAPVGHALEIHAGLTWSTDGTQLAACGGEIPAGYDGMSIMIIERATGTVTHRLLMGQFHFAGLDWARQGSNIITFHDTGGTGMIYTVNVDSETVVTVVGGSSPSWSPDNSKIVYKQRRSGKIKGGISIYEFSTGEITTLLQDGTRPDWQR